jgi:AraC-like DNA-binding protein
MPADKRAVSVAERLQQNPADDADLNALAKHAGASGRTLQRLFRAETGLNLGEWRRRLRLLHAVTVLDTGCSVTEAGFEAGYQSTSAFVAAFRTVFGFTPMQMRKSRAKPDLRKPHPRI